MKQDNRGLSLIELIVVMSLITILAGGTAIGIRLITTKEVEQCATQLKTALQGNRVTTMGKLEASLKIYTTADGICVEETIVGGDGTSGTTQKIVGDADLTIVYRLNDGTEFPLGDSSAPLIIRFNRSSGAFKALPDEMGAEKAGKYCTEIEVSRGSKAVILKLAYLTGKVTIE